MIAARCYYLCNVLHDWPDNKCVQILSQIAKAMKPAYSKILLNEMVVARSRREDSGHAERHDYDGLLGGLRTYRKSLAELIEEAGLKIEKIWTESSDNEGVIGGHSEIARTIPKRLEIPLITL